MQYRVDVIKGGLAEVILRTPVEFTHVFIPRKVLNFGRHALEAGFDALEEHVGKAGDLAAHERRGKGHR